MRVAVAGGTGLTGRHVVDSLTSAGQEPVVLSRSSGVDLVTGGGLAAALAGVDAVIDVSNVTTTRRAAAERFFTAATTHLRDAAAAAGVGHYVLLSIVGVDRVDLGYYAGKRRQEQLLAAGRVPWTVLRATQFHEFAEQVLERLRGPVAVIPAMRSRPVAVAEVADALVEAVITGPVDGYATELAGPEVLWLADMARLVLRRHGQGRGGKAGGCCRCRCRGGSAASSAAAGRCRWVSSGRASGPSPTTSTRSDPAGEQPAGEQPAGEQPPGAASRRAASRRAGGPRSWPRRTPRSGRAWSGSRTRCSAPGPRPRTWSRTAGCG